MKIARYHTSPNRVFLLTNTGAFDNAHVIKGLSNLLQNDKFSIQKGYAGRIALGLSIVVCEEPPGFHEATFAIQL
ncbi:hypothetical protein FQN50_007507 [Emmonsiellopsis sp. PD_5]|nr:hypothetical protein FQN50_007507 [Emmonsiellopsis sp. PD_5]